MSDQIELKGSAYQVAWAIRWLQGHDDLPIDWQRRRPSSLAELELLWENYRAKTLANQKDHDEEQEGTYR